MSQPATFWQKYGTLAQMAQASVALLGFVAVLVQINAIGANNRAVSARQIYLGYTELAFRNPNFAVPDYERIKAGGARRSDPLRELRLVSALCLRGSARGVHPQAGMADLVRLRGAQPPAVPV